MNEVFNFRRFGLLLKKVMVENWLQIWGVLAIAIIFSWLFYPHIEPDTEHRSSSGNVQILFVEISLLILGYNLVALFASNFSNSAKSYQYFLQPASAFEKWFCAFLITAILFPLIYLVFFRFIDTYEIKKFHDNLDPASTLYSRNYAKAFVQPYTDYQFQKLISTQLSTMAALVIGSLYFKKSVLIKSTFILICLYFFFSTLNSSLVKYYFGELLSFNITLFDGVKIDRSNINENPLRISHSSSVSFAFQIIYLYSLPAILWLIAFLRLREKEV